MIFFIDIITSVISSTLVACDVMCVQNVIRYYQKKQERRFTFRSNLNIKNLGQDLAVYFNEKNDFELHNNRNKQIYL